MVSVKATSQPAKRKKTEDMPDSPPKRVTRARAKATGDANLKCKVTKITTTSAKVAAEKKQVAEPVRTSKRKTRADDEDADVIVGAAANDEPTEQPIKTRRQRKTGNETNEASVATPTLATARSRQYGKVDAENIKSEAPKTRGRPRKVEASVATKASKTLSSEKPGPVKKTTRDRATTVVTRATRAEPPVKAPTARKRVKFMDEQEQEKENVPLRIIASEKAAVNVNGLRAKPVRKPAIAKSTTRSKKTTQTEKPNSNETTEVQVQPLSPKKAKQVAKSSSIVSEDDLCSEKTPRKTLNQSPTKPPISSIRESGRGVSTIDFGLVNAPSSPTKSVPSSILGSPARRPPPSPFKNTLKESPKRAIIGENLLLPASIKAPSPTKISFLQSPARRPVISPLKLATNESPTKSSATKLITGSTTPSKQAKPVRIPFFSPSKMMSSPLRAARLPEHNYKVHIIEPLDQNGDTEPDCLEKFAHGEVLEDAFTESISTRPVNLVNPSVESQNIQTQALSSPKSHLTAIQRGDQESDNQTKDLRSATPSGLSAPFAGSSFSFASILSEPALEESDSEDELASIRKSCIPIQSEKYGNVKTQPHPEGIHGEVEWTPIPNGNVKPYAMTPLATQLSNWLASSPEKNPTSGSNEGRRGILSPFGPTFLSKPTFVNDDASFESPLKTSFFEDEMAAREEIDDDVTVESSDSQAVRILRASQESQASEEYGDENALPADPQLIAIQPEADDLTLTCTPAKIFLQQPREIHTISKVPLRPAGEESPLKVPRKRSRSLAPLRSVTSIEASETRRSNEIFTEIRGLNESSAIQPANFSNDDNNTPNKPSAKIPQTPGASLLSNPATPFRTIRKGIPPNVLKGAVVYVDVHTSEGADASGIFLDLLTQMGARCIKQWLWNPKSGTGSSDDDRVDASPDSVVLGSKIGITHVVYKDGGKRTLEKVREAKGVVLCVGVGWVLE